jgi:Kae1-associated kinase Bud32
MERTVARRLIKQGAEASLYEIKVPGSTSEKIIEKVRVPKRYRSRELDEALSVVRLKTEAKLMAEARALGISVPIIYDINLIEKKLVMEFIEGKMVKDVLNSRYKNKRELCRNIGTSIGMLHKNHIVHGDLTTSNMLLSKDRLYFIDFSMGAKTKEIEDKGVDLHLLHEAFKSSHPGSPELFEGALKGYKSAYPDAQLVLDKMKEIEKRGRYT